ncbi:MAG TPA: DUF5665 domain-containing protein [Candidatus Saccharimonadales bacterium]|nr:DUF5665 domain-containing protein [Candidatus Saccharimonadales bacterium]
MAKQSIFSKVKKKFAKDNERGARESLLEDLFYDFNRNRVQIYKMNFVRGIFFGVGSALGGTVVIALAIWILGFFVQIPGIGQPIEKFQDTLQNSQQGAR